MEKDLICSFILLSLELEPRRIDVNAHPTKESVIFLEEEAIVDDITQVIFMLPSVIFYLFFCSVHSATSSNCRRSAVNATRMFSII